LLSSSPSPQLVWHYSRCGIHIFIYLLRSRFYWIYSILSLTLSIKHASQVRYALEMPMNVSNDSGASCNAPMFALPVCSQNAALRCPILCTYICTLNLQLAYYNFINGVSCHLRANVIELLEYRALVAGRWIFWVGILLPVNFTKNDGSM